MRIKKVPFIILLIIALLASSPAIAEEFQNMVGKQVQGQFPVKVNGKELEVQAIVIDGTSYLPIRAISEALGKEVTFDPVLGIEVKDKEVSQQVTTTQPASKPEMSDEDKEAIANAEEQILKCQRMIEENIAKIAAIDQEIGEIQKLLDGMTGDNKKYYEKKIEVLNTNKQTAIEMNEIYEQIIESSKAYIEKIKSKYE